MVKTFYKINVQPSITEMNLDMQRFQEKKLLLSYYHI